jgi:hypothetical protein
MGKQSSCKNLTAPSAIGIVQGAAIALTKAGTGLNEAGYL